MVEAKVIDLDADKTTRWLKDQGGNLDMEQGQHHDEQGRGTYTLDNDLVNR